MAVLLNFVNFIQLSQEPYLCWLSWNWLHSWCKYRILSKQKARTLWAKGAGKKEEELKEQWYRNILQLFCNFEYQNFRCVSRPMFLFRYISIFIDYLISFVFIQSHKSGTEFRTIISYSKEIYIFLIYMSCMLSAQVIIYPVRQQKMK